MQPTTTYDIRISERYLNGALAIRFVQWPSKEDLSTAIAGETTRLHRKIEELKADGGWDDLAMDETVEKIDSIGRIMEVLGHDLWPTEPADGHRDIRVAGTVIGEVNVVERLAYTRPVVEATDVPINMINPWALLDKMLSTEEGRAEAMRRLTDARAKAMLADNGRDDDDGYDPNGYPR